MRRDMMDSEKKERRSAYYTTVCLSVQLKATPASELPV